MEQLLSAPEVSLRRETSGAFFAPARPRSTCSGDATTDSSSTMFDDMEEHQQNSRRITVCKQVLLEATTKYSAAPLVDITLMKNVACRNSGALGPLLSMLAAEHDSSSMVRFLDTLSFLLMDRANRRACHELGGLDVLLDVLHRSTEQHVLLSGLESLCSLCKHDSKDKVALWRHKKKGVLLSMLNSRHGSAIVVEALRTCRTLCFAVCSGSSANAAVLSASCGSTACQDGCGRHPCGGGVPVSQRRRRSSGATGAAKRVVRHDSHYTHQHHQHGALQLLEPGLLTVVSGLLHPATDTVVLMKALKLLISASTVAVNSAGSSIADGGNCGPVMTETRAACCGCWRTPVFQLVPLLTHCADVEVVESALAVLVNLSEHSVFHWLLDASGCIPPLLHLLSHKRCGISQSASCVLSVLAEGGVPRVKLCQDMALLAMLRVLQTNHCVVVTIGVLYMLGRLASFRGAVVRSLKGWGAIPLLNRLLATTRDLDAAEGCRQLLQVLGVQSPPAQLTVGPAKVNMPNAHSSISVYGGAGGLVDSTKGVITGAESVPGMLMRTISAAATVAESVSPGLPDGQVPAATADSNRAACHAPLFRSGPMGVGPEECESGSVAAAVVRPRQHNSFRLYTGGATAAVTCGLLGTIAAAAAAAY